MLGCRDEYGHYRPVTKVIQMSEHIEPEPRCSGKSQQIDPLILYEARTELSDYIQHLRNDYELNGSLEFY